MKRYLIPAAFLLVLLFSLSAHGQTLQPLDNESLPLDPDHETYCLGLRDTDHILDGGWFTAALYTYDFYDAQAIEALSPGDTACIDGEDFSVSQVIWHEDGICEIYTNEDFDGYLVFTKVSPGFYTALVNDWVPCSFLGDVRIMLPLPDCFTFTWTSEEDDVVLTADEFISMITQDDPPLLVPYNTVIVFEDGVPVSISHADYPEGPEH